MKTRLILIFLSLSVVIYSQEIDSTLLKAYKYNSKVLLDEFFTNWEISFETSNNEFINQNDTVRELYEVLSVFYHSFVDNEKAKYYSPLACSTKYFILKDKLEYRISYTSELKEYDYKDKTPVRRVINFKPFEKIADTKFLYINDKYYKSISEFFKVPYGYKNFEEQGFYKSMKIYDKKVNFLADYIKIIHKGNIASPVLYFVELLSDPIIEFIKINKDLDKCFIYYSMGCTTMEAQFSKIDAVWTKIKERWLWTC